MNLKLKKIYTPLIFFIIIIETTGIDSDESSPDENPRPGTRGRIIKSYSGARPEPIICTGEGFVKDPHNCAMFYRCMKSGNNKYTIFRFQCGPGTIYDPDHEVCNHPQSTTRSECIGISPPFIHTTHINDIQDSMYNEIPSPMVSSKQIQPSNTLQKTSIMNVKQTPPSNAINSTTKLYILSTTASPYPWASSINLINVDRNLHKTTVKPLSTETKISQSISRDNICTSDGFMGDNENCRKFYRCVVNQKGGFTRYEFMCSETTVWDEVNQICNHVWAVKKSRCSLYNEKVTDSNMQFTTEKLHTPEKNTMELHIKENTKDNTVHTIQEQLQIGYGTKVTQSQTQIGNGFVEQNQTQINYGDRLNQNENKGSKQNQTQISHGSAVSQSQIQINYGNTGVQTQLQIDHSKEASQNQIQISETSTRKSSTTIFQLENQEEHKADSTDCTEDGFIGDSNDCQKFYRCVNNGQGGFKKFGFNCADGTAWDSSIKSCNHIWAVKECNLHGPVESSQHTVTTIYKTTQSYHTTMSTEHTTPQSIADNEDSNSSGYGNSMPESMQTPPSSTTITTLIDSNGTKCVSDGFIGDSNDCKIFYRCVEDGNGGFTKHIFKCGEGTLWDPEIKACNHAWAVAKCNGNISSDINKLESTTKNTKTSTPIYIQSTTSAHFPTISSDEHEFDVNNLPGYGQSNNEIQTTTTTTSSKRPPIWGQLDNICKSSGFTGDKYDCKKFYRCVDNGHGGFSYYEYTCSTGTVWDNRINACGSSDCKRFYRCVDDGNGSYIRYEFLCGEGTLWDQELKSCNHAWAVTKCGSNSESLPINNDLNHKIPPNANADSQISSTTSAFPTSSETTEQETTSELCVSSGYFGDIKHCEKFYRCVDNGKGSFIRHEYVCGEGTVWDQSLEACNHRSAVKECDFTKNTTTNVPSEGTIEYSVTFTTSLKYEDSPVTQNVLAVLLSKNDSSVICTKEGFIADPKNCKSFYRCVNDGRGGLTKYQYSCGEGTYWNQEILSCDHDTGEADCNSQTTTKPMANEHHPQTTENYAPSSSEYLLGDKLNYDNDSSAIEPPPNSAGACLSEGYYPNEKDCRRFYQCVDNGKGAYTKYDHICGEGTAWDPNTQICTHIDQVSSCKESVTHDADNTQTTESSGSTTQGLTSSTTSMTTSSSPDSNLHTMDVCASEGYFGNTQDCKKFYRCVNDGKGGYTKYDFICAEGTIWDKDIPTCNHPKNVANPSCNQNTTTSNSTTNTSESNEGQNEASKVPGNSSVNCTKAGFYPDPNNCKKFYRCVDWDGNETKFSIFHFECGEGTIWDPAVDTCNHEDSVYPPRNCSGSQASVTEETTTTEKESTTKSSTQATSQSLTESTTQSTTTSTSEPTNQITTESATTESAAQTTTERSEESTTEQSGKSTTDRSGEGSTEQPPESTTERLGESTTEQSQETTTEQLGENTTKESVESTTEQLKESTTEKLGESTTEKLGENTTEKSVESTSEPSGESTTEQSTESTTKESIENTTTEGSGTVQTTTEQQETTESGTDYSTQKPAESDCPKIEDDQNLFVCPSSFRRHPKYCNLFYQCDENEDSHELKIAVFACPNNTIYDENKTKCVNESKAEKTCDGEISQKRRVKRKERIGNILNDPLVVSEKSLGCSNTGYFAFEKEGDCSQGFLKCTSTKSNKLRGLVYQCPESYIFWNVSKRCEPLYKVSDCKRSLVNDWSSRREIPIEIQNVAW
ncbi:unnamed protein product [Arctia plantaginis]|uniref:Chitin-binding type-2 domain-containing protein n=1 Tax=Arctia plantaginis TaxID=874455 RepID=A0A8S0YWP3_ARCPL|nr:unnamed protein product [Arctia plantaginis]